MFCKPASIVGFMLIAALSGSRADTTGTQRALDKKLIEYGWDVPFTDYVRANLPEMEKRPFDGLIFKLRGGGLVMTPKPLDEAAFAPDLENLKQTEWKQFTDNFVILWAASDQDWFNDEHWQVIEHNAKLMARCAKVGRCVGVCFDQEPYGTNPWSYVSAAHHDTKSFAEYEAVTRKRGAQFVRALESEFPGLAILTFFQLSYFPQLLIPMDSAQRATSLSQMHYALLPAFLNGMLDAASPEVRIIDGNESAYYYTERLPYFEVCQRIAQRGLLLVEPELWPKYRAQAEVGQALYIDQYFGLRAQKVLGHYLTPEERPQWFEHNVYWSLYTTDKYVWCYSERMNWWTSKDVPPGCEEAIRSARKKLAAGAGLGFDLAPVVEAGKKRERDEIASRLKVQTADIARLPQGTAAPTIDGRVDDAAWTATKPLPPFVALASRPEKLAAATQAWVTYDDKALYLAVRCVEPNPQKLSLAGEKHDDPVWQGDDVEVLLSVPGKATPFYHFMLNPAGVAWDGVHHDETADLSYAPVWQHAVQTGAKEWDAELAIPWAALSMSSPTPGTKVRANLCRQRMQGSELSAWSPMATGFLEPDLFGTWVFR
ncbi:MAG: hypothetical protein AUJ96_29450 [Armatimonadetes bacterium CG2_30_66_41]|nr:hypothetical protein [Armatimonadota bacterium]OIO93931.1 MAG: hypothetical protein AUJ96_29450 [Armatimonadetes bacterium CG2_30_66_41]NCO90849.1 hypothetical protein [Armatimonadota bacterium]NCP30799.1 hypothetical protein [Armatimonadota bacterium]NCQ31142.1 hypothetical protein [Armatimonadota bacterium]